MRSLEPHITYEILDARANRFLWLLGSPFLVRLKQEGEAPISSHFAG